MKYASNAPTGFLPLSAISSVNVVIDVEEPGFDKLKEKVVNPLSGQKIAAYYGCLLLRPNTVMQMDDPENPKIMEDFIRAIGGDPVIYANRNECCGGYIAMESPALAKKKSTAVTDNAKAAGAEKMVTACPLCRYNLIKNGSDIPVVYFTELLAEALGLDVPAVHTMEQAVAVLKKLKEERAHA